VTCFCQLLKKPPTFVKKTHQNRDVKKPQNWDTKTKQEINKIRVDGTDIFCNHLIATFNKMANKTCSTFNGKQMNANGQKGSKKN